MNAQNGMSSVMVTSQSFAFMVSAFPSAVLLVWMSAVFSLRCGNELPRTDRRKTIIRPHLPQETGSDYRGLVRLKGLEPTRLSTREPKSRMSANSITGAYFKQVYFIITTKLCQGRQAGQFPSSKREDLSSDLCVLRRARLPVKTVKVMFPWGRARSRFHRLAC